MVDLARQNWRDYEVDGVAASGKHKPNKAKIRQWGAWVESVITAFTSNGGLVYATRALLYADLLHGANTSAWVVSDSTGSYNGIYQKSGISGAGAWTRIADLPYSFITCADAGAGTANAIVATSGIPAPSTAGAALFLCNIFEVNSGAVTLALNGAVAKPVVTNSGNALSSGYLVAGMQVMFIDDGTNWRLVSDVASAAIQAAAEAAQAASEIAQSAAEAAAASLVIGYQFVYTIAEARALDPTTHPVIKRNIYGYEKTYHYDATFPANRYGFDADAVFMLPKDAAYTADGAWVAEVKGFIDVREYGLVEGGTNNDTQWNKLLTFAQYATQFLASPSSGPTGSPELRFPSGVFAFSDERLMQNFFSTKFTGAGMVSTAWLHLNTSADDYALHFDHTFATSFSDMWIVSGEVDPIAAGFYAGLPQITVTAEASQTKRFIDWRANATGGNRQIYASGCRFSGWEIIFDVGIEPAYGGALTGHSENFSTNCEFRENKVVAFLNNNQSVNWSFVNCITEFNTVAVVDVVAGGHISFYSGSHINYGDLIRLRPSATGSGPSNAIIKLDGLKFEHGKYYDAARTPQIIRTYASGAVVDGITVGDTVAYISMRDCQYLSGTNFDTAGARDTIMNLIGGNMSLTLDNCDLYGDVVLEVPSSWTGSMPRCIIRNCRYAPNIVLTDNGSGKFWIVEYEGVQSALDKSIAKTTVDGSVNMMRPMIRAYNSLGTIASAGDTLFTIDVPVNDALCQAPKLVFSRVNAVQCDLTFYSDSARTKSVMTANLSNSAGEREFYGTLATGGLASDYKLVDGKLYAKLTCTAGGSGVTVLKSFVFTASQV